MKAAGRDAIARALGKPGPDTRLFLLHGPDESGSRGLLGLLVAAMGKDADRVRLSAGELADDPVRLSDEAASFSMFGGSRYIVVDASGRPDDLLPAVTALLDAPAAGNPVALIFPSALPATSKLLALAQAHPAVQAFASYPPEARDAGRLTLDLARDAGLRLTPDLARRVAEDCANDRALIAQEVEKLAIYLDAAPDRPRDLGHDDLDKLSAGAERGDLSRFVDAVLDGQGAALDVELARLAAERVEGVALVRALLRRLHLLSRLAAEVARGNSIDSVLGSYGKALFWRDRKPVAAQLARWKPDRVATAIERAAELERGLKRPGTPGTVAVDEELFRLAQAAARFA